MCLITLDDKEKTEKLGKTGKGWKVFCIKNGKIMGQFYGGPYEKGEKYKSLPTKIKSGLEVDNGKTYTMGFHIFLNEPGALGVLNIEKYCSALFVGSQPHIVWCILPVKWSQPIASGTEWGRCPVLVAKYMTILE